MTFCFVIKEGTAVGEATQYDTHNVGTTEKGFGRRFFSLL
jgi:hypothetical protein